MTAEVQAMTMEETAPMTVVADMAATDPILTNAELNLELAAKRLSIPRAKESAACSCIGLTLAMLCRLHLSEPKPANQDDDPLHADEHTRRRHCGLVDYRVRCRGLRFCVHLIAGLRVYLSGSCI
jgi:hypothetical protein